MAGLFIDLMEADFFPLGRRWKQRDRTRDERQLQVAFPIRARGHDNYSELRGTLNSTILREPTFHKGTESGVSYLFCTVKMAKLPWSADSGLNHAVKKRIVTRAQSCLFCRP